MNITKSHTQDLALAIGAAYHGGTVALRHPQRGIPTPYSPELGWQKTADQDVEQAIVAYLQKARPDYGVLGEESGSHGPEEVRWLVDPIDGTKYFARNIPKWTVHIALEVSGDIMLGVCYNPSNGDLLYALRNMGAFYNFAPLRVSKRPIPEALILYTNIKSFIETGYKDGFYRLLDSCKEINSFGSYEGFRLVVQGQAEASLKGSGSPHDIAVQKIVTEEAGGRFSDLAGNDTIYSHSFILSNGVVHDEILRLLNDN